MNKFIRASKVCKAVFRTALHAPWKNKQNPQTGTGSGHPSQIPSPRLTFSIEATSWKVPQSPQNGAVRWESNVQTPEPVRFVVYSNRWWECEGKWTGQEGKNLQRARSSFSADWLWSQCLWRTCGSLCLCCSRTCKDETMCFVLEPQLLTPVFYITGWLLFCGRTHFLSDTFGDLHQS